MDFVATFYFFLSLFLKKKKKKKAREFCCDKIDDAVTKLHVAFLAAKHVANNYVASPKQFIASGAQVCFKVHKAANIYRLRKRRQSCHCKVDFSVKNCFTLLQHQN